MSTETFNTEFNDEMPISEMNKLFISDRLLITDSLAPFLARNQLNIPSDIEPSDNWHIEQAKELKKQINETFDSVVKIRAFHFLEEWSFLVRDERNLLTCPKEDVLTKLFGELSKAVQSASINGINEKGIKIDIPVFGEPNTVKEALYYHETNRFDIADLFLKANPGIKIYKKLDKFF